MRMLEEYPSQQHSTFNLQLNFRIFHNSLRFSTDMRLIECILPVIAVLGACGREGDKGHKIPAPEAYTTMTYCFNGTSIVSNLDKYGIIDTTGNVILPLRYDNITYITDEIAAAREKGLYCLVDTKGHVLAECIRDGEMTADEMAAWAEDVSKKVRQSWDDVLAGYGELSDLCRSEAPDNEAIRKKAEEIRESLAKTVGSMSKDQKAQFESVRNLQ